MSSLNPVAQSLKNLGIPADQIKSQALFIYSTPTALALTVSGGATPSATSVIQVQADSFFELQRLSFRAFVTGTPATALTYPAVNLQIADSASGANLFDTAVPVGAVAYGGAGFGPFPVSSPRFFAPNSTVTLTLTNADSANAITIVVNLQGRKLFKG